jgi:hypothetical protein
VVDPSESGNRAASLIGTSDATSRRQRNLDLQSLSIKSIIQLPRDIHAFMNPRLARQSDRQAEMRMRLPCLPIMSRQMPSNHHISRQNIAATASATRVSCTFLRGPPSKGSARTVPSDYRNFVRRSGRGIRGRSRSASWDFPAAGILGPHAHRLHLPNRETYHYSAEQVCIRVFVPGANIKFPGSGLRANETSL